MAANLLPLTGETPVNLLETLQFMLAEMSIYPGSY